MKEPDYISRDAMRQVWNNCCGIRGKYAVFLIRDTDRISNPDQLKEILPIAFPDEKRVLYCLSKNERETVVLAEMIDGDLQKSRRIYMRQSPPLEELICISAVPMPVKR